MHKEIQVTNLVVKITEFQFRTLTWQHKVIVGHSNESNPVHVATKPRPLEGRPLLRNSLEGPEFLKLNIHEFIRYFRPSIIGQ